MNQAHTEEQPDRQGLPWFVWLVWSIAILLMTAFILLPNFNRQVCRGDLTACKSYLSNISIAMEMYSTDYAGQYPRNLSLLTPNYLKDIPICPSSNGVQTYRASFGTKVPCNSAHEFLDYYLIECTGESHVSVSLPPDYPKYDGIQGLIER